ncbi:MAG: DUF4382 domain-containing protein [Halosimplex sp.]
MKRALLAVATALLVVTAGCAASPGAGTPTVGGSDGGAGGSGADTVGDGDGSATAGDAGGAVNFYVSDRPNDMDDFEHLNVTVTTVKFHLVDPADDGSEDGTVSTATATEANVTVTDADANTSTATAKDAPEIESEQEVEDESGDEGEDGRWVAREVNATTVDLSALRGANATRLDKYDLPAGEYDKVLIEVSAVEGTLTNGESATVKLPRSSVDWRNQEH